VILWRLGWQLKKEKEFELPPKKELEKATQARLSLTHEVPLPLLRPTNNSPCRLEARLLLLRLPWGGWQKEGATAAAVEAVVEAVMAGVEVEEH
jgi:hypothetical protein